MYASVTPMGRTTAKKSESFMAQKTEETPITLDFSGMKEAVIEANKDMVRQIKEAFQPAAPAAGKGYTMPTEKASKLVESLQSVRKDGWKLEEQWTVVIPALRTHELRANLRDYVYVSEILKEEPGDVLNVPYVSDVDFLQCAAVGNAWTTTWAEASLISVVTTTMYEAGDYADISYATIEKINQNLLEEINSVLAVAAVRAEDKKIMQLIEAGTSTNYADDLIYRSGKAGTGTLSVAAANFYSSNIPYALKALLKLGKRVTPDQCVLYLTPAAYGALLQEVVSSQVFAFASPALINQGVVEKLLGVGIVIGGYHTSQQRTNQNTGTVDLCFLMRAKRAVVLAPKRELLVETQKQIATRKLRITASHTFGIKILDFKEIVRIWTSNKGAT
jgi:hypothetical protein